MTEASPAIDLFEHAKRARDRGMGDAEFAQELAAPGSNERAFQEIRMVALRQSTVHANDLRHVTLEHYNAWGSIWRRAMREKIIQRTTETRRCLDPKKNLHHSPQYASLIYRSRT